MSHWIHASIAALGIAAGTWWVDAPLRAVALVVASIGYASWTARRGVGIVFAIGAASLHVDLPLGDATAWTLIPPAAWLVVYITTVLVVSSVERATRPEVDVLMKATE